MGRSRSRKSPARRRACPRASASAACALPRTARPWRRVRRFEAFRRPNSLLFCSRAAGSRDGGSFASSRAARNPRRNLAGERRGRGARGEPRRGDRARGGDPAHHPERAARRAAARLSRAERARPAGAVRLRPSGALRGADLGGAEPNFGPGAAGERCRCGGLVAADRRAAARRCSPIPTGASARARGPRT